MDIDGIDFAYHKESATGLLQNRETQGILRSHKLEKSIFSSTEYSTPILSGFLPVGPFVTGNAKLEELAIVL